MPRVVLGRELNRPTEAGALDHGVQVSNDPVAEFETDVRALVEAEQVARLVAEAVLAQVLVEAMTEVKVPAAHGKSQRRWQIDDDEVRLRKIERCVVVRRFLRASRRGRDEGSDQGQDGESAPVPGVSWHAAVFSKRATSRKPLQ